MRYWRYIDADGTVIIEMLSGGMVGAVEVSQAEYDLAHPPPAPAVSEARRLALLLRAKGILTIAELGSL